MSSYYDQGRLCRKDSYEKFACRSACGRVCQQEAQDLPEARQTRIASRSFKSCEPFSAECLGRKPMLRGKRRGLDEEWLL